MAIDTQTKRRSVSGYTNHLIAPVADGTISAADREHMAWLYSGIGGATPADDSAYVGDTYYYDSSAGTGSINDGTPQENDYRYD